MEICRLFEYLGWNQDMDSSVFEISESNRTSLCLSSEQESLTTITGQLHTVSDPLMFKQIYTKNCLTACCWMRCDKMLQLFARDNLILSVLAL
jgi:hypothetical protein